LLSWISINNYVLVRNWFKCEHSLNYMVFGKKKIDLWDLKSFLVTLDPLNSVFSFANFLCIYTSFFGTWFVCYVFILYFGLGLLLVVSEPYFESSKLMSSCWCKIKRVCVALIFLFLGCIFCMGLYEQIIWRFHFALLCLWYWEFMFV
jgi:hypothetical protein